MVQDFLVVAKLAGITVPPDAVSVDTWTAPHRPKGLPYGWMAAYVFLYGNRALKIGKAGPNSDARFRSQHYSFGSSNSNLARSLLQAGHRVGVEVTDTNVGEWIREHTTRVNFLLRGELGIPLLTLLEAFLQCRLSPEFEGFATQRPAAVQTY
jgi:hypothetical protein